MGTASSVEPKERLVRTHRRSVRQQFNHEFGKSVSFDDASKQKDEVTLPKIVEGKPAQDGQPSEATVPGTTDDSPGEITNNKLKFNAAVFRAKTLFMRPIMKNRPEKDKLVVKKQDNHGLLKEMFKRMDPSLNSGASTHPIVGEVELAVKFKPEDNTLLVKVGRTRGIKKEDCFGAPDPYVAVDIFSSRDASDIITRKTNVKKGSFNPSFQEILSFPLTQQQISLTKLRIGVWDRVSSTLNDFLGETVLDLCKLDLIVGSVIWYKLHPKTDLSFCGHIDVCVTFKEPKSLLVLINRANGIKICDTDDGSSNPYARVYVTGLPNKYQTDVQKNTINPVWEESFEFDVYPSEFSRRVVVITLLNKDTSGGRDQHLGSVHIPMSEYDYKQSGGSKEYPLADLRSSPFTKNAWSDEGVALEFNEAMKAHLIYGYPKFLFKKHQKGKKMISCHSKKAQTQVKMIIQNGIATGEQVEM